MKEYNLSKDFKDKNEIQDKDIQSLFFAFLNRARFKYSVKDILEYSYKCLCLRNLSIN